MPGSWHIWRLSYAIDAKYRPTLVSLVCYPNFHRAIDALVFAPQRYDLDSLQLTFSLRIDPNLENEK